MKKVLGLLIIVAAIFCLKILWKKEIESPIEPSGTSSWKIKTADGREDEISDLVEAVEWGRMDAIEYFLNKGSELNAYDPWGDTALHKTAISFGDQVAIAGPAANTTGIGALNPGPGQYQWFAGGGGGGSRDAGGAGGVGGGAAGGGGGVSPEPPAIASHGSASTGGGGG